MNIVMDNFSIWNLKYWFSLARKRPTASIFWFDPVFLAQHFLFTCCYLNRLLKKLAFLKKKLIDTQLVRLGYFMAPLFLGYNTLPTAPAPTQTTQIFWPCSNPPHHQFFINYSTTLGFQLPKITSSALLDIGIQVIPL